MMSSIHIDPKGPRCLALVFIILMLPFPASPLLALAHQSSNLLHILLYFLYPHRLFFLCYELVFFFQHIHFEYSLRPRESTFSFVSFNSYSCSLRSLKTQMQYLHLFRFEFYINSFRILFHFSFPPFLFKFVIFRNHSSGGNRQFLKLGNKKATDITRLPRSYSCETIPFSKNL